MEKFIKEDLEFYLPHSYKGLSKQYILDKVFNEEIQKNWKPQEGDVMIGSTGNIFCISGKHELHTGDLYFFGGGLCSRDGGYILNETYSYTMNEDGLWYEPGERPREDPYHSKISDFRYVPYPHEL